MELALSILLIPYAIFVISFFVFGFFNLYHMIAYGFVSASSFVATFLFLAGATIVLFLSYSIGTTIDWGTAITISNSLTY